MQEHERLTKIREELGFSLKDIAQELGVTVKRIQQWENGETKMKFCKYVALAKLYKLSIDYIVGLTDTLHKLIK